MKLYIWTETWAIAVDLSYTLIFVKVNEFLLSMAFLGWKNKAFCDSGKK